MIKNPIKILIAYLLIITSFDYVMVAQTDASPANWLFPDGNPNATKLVPFASDSQNIRNFNIKWSSSAISGDITPLIGNIIVQEKLFPEYPYAPNEMVAIVGDKLVILDGTGTVKETDDLPNYINGVSVLFDSNRTSYPNRVQAPVIMGLETIETSRAELEDLPDTLALAYLAGFNHITQKPNIIKRLAVDMRGVSPNFSAYIKPYYGKSFNNEIQIYALVSSQDPIVDSDSTFPVNPPFYRGVFQFDASKEIANYPFSDIGYDTNNIAYLAPELLHSQPSITNNNDFGFVNALIGLQPVLASDYQVRFDFNIITRSTFSDTPYIIDVQMSDNKLGTLGKSSDISQDINGTRPKIRNYFIDLWNHSTSQQERFILVSEQYSGVDNSIGTSYLHLRNADNPLIPLTLPLNPDNPSFKGGSNHNWSVATGNLDGQNNQSLEFYPNNPGNEVIVSQSTRDFAFPNSRISVLKYNGTIKEIPKTSPPNSTLNPFDTICTQKINGWIAAVNDLDNDPNDKDEILVVNGSRIMVLQMRDYDTKEFQLGNRFDTLYTQNFEGETISYAQIADMEGDGRNDVIVTTFQRTYVIGSPLDNILDVFEPVNQSDQYCIGDTIDIKWRNLIQEEGTVSLYFLETDLTGNPTGYSATISRNIDNSLDSITYRYEIDTLVIGRSGAFIISSDVNPTEVFDVSGVNTFNIPNINEFYNVPNPEYTVGDMIDFSGEIFCYDSLIVEYSEFGNTWTRAAIDSSQVSNTFNIEAEIPCLDAFDWQSDMVSQNLSWRLVTYKSQLIDYSTTFSTDVIPYPFDFQIDSLLTADPTKEFIWDPLFNDYPCDTVVISFRTGSNSFSMIEEVPIEDGSYKWQLPISLQDTLQLRISCKNSCVMGEAIGSGFKVRNIQLVAPNPFRPPREELEIVYFVGNDVNVTIRIFDQNNRLVATPVDNVPRRENIAYTDRWDGYTEKGDLANNGLYYIMLELSNGVTEIYPVYLRK
ncbi:hypothetical protein OAQ99_00435 [Candidatus Kapabacteria bacterium]|nr:hypothetical protein [Candidatus Kapabacteria bacterium]